MEVNKETFLDFQASVVLAALVLRKVDQEVLRMERLLSQPVLEEMLVAEAAALVSMRPMFCKTLALVDQVSVVPVVLLAAELVQTDSVEWLAAEAAVVVVKLEPVVTVVSLVAVVAEAALVLLLHRKTLEPAVLVMMVMLLSLQPLVRHDPSSLA
jgi:hypothetical protein